MATIPIRTEVIRMVPGVTNTMSMIFLLDTISLRSIQMDIANQKKGINSVAVPTEKIGEVIICTMSIPVMLMLLETVAKS